MVTQTEVLKEAISLAKLTIVGASKKIGMSDQTLYPKVQGKRLCRWDELNELCVKICGKPAYSIATTLSVRKLVEEERQG